MSEAQQATPPTNGGMPLWMKNVSNLGAVGVLAGVCWMMVSAGIEQTKEDRRVFRAELQRLYERLDDTHDKVRSNQQIIENNQRVLQTNQQLMLEVSRSLRDVAVSIRDQKEDNP